ncbi:MAG TPA: DNA translocase FtsK 4TM domain-containing protein [Thermoanaerobaculia bacterium]|nr:DNA translocase FtsK 4TM domain-containing protein [Thermoanaerobaculia bacterium]
MSVARAERKARPLALWERKGRELAGLLLAIGGLFLLASLLSHDPRDPSLLHEQADEVEVRNLIGPFGAELSALAFGLLGLPVLLIPLVMIWAGAQRLFRRGGEPVVGRGLGLILALITLPPLLQLLLGSIGIRGDELDAGGAVGVFVAGSLIERLGFLGALLVTLGILAIGIALALQNSLDDVMRAGAARFAAAWRLVWLSWTRRRERRERERSRRTVVAKHLERARRRKRESGVEPAAEEIVQAGPVRVRERRGDGGFAIRRVAGASPSEDPELAVSSLAAEAPSAQPIGGASKPAARSARRPGPDPSAPAVPAGSQRDLGFSVSAEHQLPPLNVLTLEEESRVISEDELVRLGDLIRDRCAEFGVVGSVEAITPGPVITVYEFQPAPGVKVSQIVNLQDDLALSLKAEAIRIDRMPGRSTLGIEVPNARRSTIRLGPLLADPGFRKSPSPLTMAIGRTLHGEPYFGDLATMPHLLVAGATGAGKSVGLQSMITSILYKATRDQVQFIFIDPKRIELGVYKDIPHLKTEVVVEPKKAANALRWAVGEMERRYKLLAEVHVRSIDYYNRAIRDPEVQKRLSLRDDDGDGEVFADDLKPLPYYVVIIDELADLMMVSSAEVEQSIARLAQMARAVGIHLIVATQRPSVDVLTGTIKANFPCRLSFATATRHDSRTILDQIGAEKLLGKGDMLFLPPASSRPIRLHGAYVSEQETAALVRWLKKQGKPELDPDVLKAPIEERSGGADGSEGQDELFGEAARLVVSEGMGSASFLQRRMRVGFSRAARLIDMLEHDGILGPAQGSKPREVLVKPDFFQELEG